ncbi:MAG: hypothetical protein L3J56_10505 [Bacteroidales bacterium]|nr:hypothetical protein [Bacteroidales bacterium]
MTKEQLIKKARYFGVSTGREFTYLNDKVIVRGTELFFEIPVLQIFFDRYTDKGIVTLLIELPKEIKNLERLKIKKNEKCKAKKMRKAR